MADHVTVIERPDGLRYCVAETPQPGIPTFTAAECRALWDGSHLRPLTDETVRALLAAKTVFQDSRVLHDR